MFENCSYCSVKLNALVKDEVSLSLVLSGTDPLALGFGLESMLCYLDHLNIKVSPPSCSLPHGCQAGDAGLDEFAALSVI